MDLPQLDTASALSAPTMVEGLGFVGVQPIDQSDGAVIALDLETGQELWRYTRPQMGSFSNVAVEHRRVLPVETFLEGGELRSVLHAVDDATGQPVWTFRTTSDWFHFLPVARATRVFITTFGSENTNTSTNVIALDADTGTESWRFSSPEITYYAGLTAGRRRLFLSAWIPAPMLDLMMSR
jgi:outer membrane protein assembly factor BamB